MRVLIAIHGFPPTHYAGAERAGERIARWLVQNQHHVEIFAIEQVNSPEVKIETTTENGMVIHRVYYDIRSGGSPFQNTYNHPVLGQFLREKLKEGRFDIIHMISGYLLGGQVIDIAHEFNVPAIITLTEYWFMCARLNLLMSDNTLCTGPENDMKCARCILEDKRRYRLPGTYAPVVMDVFWKLAEHTSFATEKTNVLTQRRIELQRTLNKADFVICPSHFIRNQFAKYNFDVSRYGVITHGINGPESNRQTKPINKGKVLRLGYVGQIKPHKGVDLAVDAATQLINEGFELRLDIWGPTPADSVYVNDLKRASKNYTDVVWHGAYTHEQLWDVLASFDVLIVPSRWYENSPTVILEAYKMGLPVIVTNLGGMAEMVEHEKSGLRFELNNLNDLKKQLKRLVTEPDLQLKLKSGVPYVKNSDEEIAEIFSHYMRLLVQKQA